MLQKAGIPEVNGRLGRFVHAISLLQVVVLHVVYLLVFIIYFLFYYYYYYFYFYFLFFFFFGGGLGVSTQAGL